MNIQLRHSHLHIPLPLAPPMQTGWFLLNNIRPTIATRLPDMAQYLLLQPIIVPRRRHRLLEPRAPQEQVLQWQQNQKHFVAQEREQHNKEARHRVQPIVVRSRDDGSQHEGGIADSQRHEEELLPSRR